MKIELENQTSFQAANRKARDIAKANGWVWKDCEVFITFKEKGRYAMKSAGYESLGAGG